MRRQLAVCAMSIAASLSSLGADLGNYAVVVGRLEAFEPKGEMACDAERAFYVHVPVQYLLIKIDHILSGNALYGPVLLHVEVDRGRPAYVTELSPLCVVLKPEVWKPGIRIVARIQPVAPPIQAAVEASHVARAPDGMLVESLVEDASGGLKGTPVFSTSTDEVFIVLE